MGPLEERYEGMLTTLRNGGGTPIIPATQIDFLDKCRRLNPTLRPIPQYWWGKTFDWYIEVELVFGGRYGPFYRVNEGQTYWPEIGNPNSTYSEVGCFLGLTRPNNRCDYKTLYNPIETPSDPYVFEIMIERVDREGGPLFLGPVAGGTAFQINPNSVTVDLIKSVLVSPEWDPEKLVTPLKNS